MKNVEDLLILMSQQLSLMNSMLLSKKIEDAAKPEDLKTISAYQTIYKAQQQSINLIMGNINNERRIDADDVSELAEEPG